MLLEYRQAAGMTGMRKGCVEGSPMLCCVQFRLRLYSLNENSLPHATFSLARRVERGATPCLPAIYAPATFYAKQDM